MLQGEERGFLGVEDVSTYSTDPSDTTQVSISGPLIKNRSLAHIPDPRSFCTQILRTEKPRINNTTPPRTASTRQDRLMVILLVWWLGGRRSGGFGANRKVQMIPENCASARALIRSHTIAHAF